MPEERVVFSFPPETDAGLRVNSLGVHIVVNSSGEGCWLETPKSTLVEGEVWEDTKIYFLRPSQAADRKEKR